ncbi:MAG: 6,7-dimethyl-8-ribityllumazine synthase [Bacteroidetes bacterium]|nr:6,7-dimethyl-8-ribityllumazine synthase [Bacteroidota bacterium]
MAEWNNGITHALRDGALEVLNQAGIPEKQITLLSVPGAFELGLSAQWLFQNGCDAVICLGCVVRGDTPHFDYVCQAATDGILRAGMDVQKPCIFGIITTENQQQAEDRAGGKLGNKGSEAAHTALWMLAAHKNLQ